jgi:8-oxo-dGTP pyrophosphatase MutT (NUDIX family)
MDLYTQQKLTVYDLVTKQPIGEEKRHIVHTSGLWHMSTVAYFLLKDPKDTIRVLVQKRSGDVDISKGLFDQSLATQRRDFDRNPEESLIRRSKEEYGLDLSSFPLKQYFLNTDLTISKFSPGEKNCEILNFFFAHTPEEEIQSKNLHADYISDAFWINWSEMIRQIRTEPLIYTRTARLFCLNDEIVKYIEDSIQSFLFGKPMITEFPASAIHFESVNPLTEEVYIQRKNGKIDWYQYDKKTTKLLRHEQREHIVRS